MAVSSTIGPALVGLGGVVVGGAMTMVTVWWQTVNARKDRLAEMEIDFRHKRLLRDEATRQAALLELLYVLRRLHNCVYEIDVQHGHDGRGPSLETQCTLDDMPALVAIAEQVRDLTNKYRSVLGCFDGDLQTVCEAWETIYIEKEHHLDRVYAENDVKKSDFCDIGADVACLELMIRPVIAQFEKELDSILLK